MSRWNLYDTEPKKGRTCGLISTYSHGCRCRQCKEAGRLAKAKYRAKKRVTRT